jgi:hypothetical protein
MFFVCFQASAEDEPGWIRISPSMSTPDQTLYLQALSLDPSLKSGALDSIMERISRGEPLSSNVNVLFIVRRLAIEGDTLVRPGRGGESFPDVRRYACSVLRGIGGPLAGRIVEEVLRNEVEPMVIAEAVYSLPFVDPPAPGTWIPLLKIVLRTKVVGRHEDNLAFACLATYEKLYGTDLAARDQEIFSQIFSIYEGDYNSVVRRKAESVIERIIAAERG